MMLDGLRVDLEGLAHWHRLLDGALHREKGGLILIDVIVQRGVAVLQGVILD